MNLTKKQVRESSNNSAIVEVVVVVKVVMNSKAMLWIQQFLDLRKNAVFKQSAFNYIANLFPECVTTVNDLLR